MNRLVLRGRAFSNRWPTPPIMRDWNARNQTYFILYAEFIVDFRATGTRILKRDQAYKWDDTTKLAIKTLVQKVENEFPEEESECYGND